MKKLLRILFLCVPFVLFHFPRIVYYSIRKKKLSKMKIYLYAQNFLKKLLRKLGMDLEVRGRENLPCTDSYLLVGNHQSLMDPLIVLSTTYGPLSFVAKKELQHVIGVSNFISMVNGLFMNRSSLRKEMEIMKAVKKSLKEDQMAWCIFPEGTRSKNERKEVGKFLPGSLKMAMSEEKIIVPFVVEGGYEVLSLKGKWKAKTILKILPPISCHDYQNIKTTELAPLIEKKISEVQKELYKEIHGEIHS